MFSVELSFDTRGLAVTIGLLYLYRSGVSVGGRLQAWARAQWLSRIHIISPQTATECSVLCILLPGESPRSISTYTPRVLAHHTLRIPWVLTTARKLFMAPQAACVLTQSVASLFSRVHNVSLSCIIIYITTRYTRLATTLENEFLKF